MTPDYLQQLSDAATPLPVYLGSPMTPADWTLTIALRNAVPEIIAALRERDELRMRLAQAADNLETGMKLHDCPGLADAAKLARKALEPKP